MTRYAIVGSRDYPSPDLVKAFVDQLPDDAVIVSGGFKGVDTVAVEAAEARGLEVQVFPADWARYGQSAGPRRIQTIVENSDEVVAFWDGASRGTLNTVELAREAGLPVTIYDGDGSVVPIDVALTFPP